MFGLKKLVIYLVIASLLFVAALFVLNKYSYFDILNTCFIMIHQDDNEGNREVIQKALNAIKQEDSEVYKMVCNYVDTISENYCVVISPDSPDVKKGNSKGCYIKGSKNIILVPQKENSDKAVADRVELIKAYAAKSRLYWLGISNQNATSASAENILPTPTLKVNQDNNFAIPQITADPNSYKEWQTFTDSSNKVSFMYPPNVPSFDLTNNPDILKQTPDNLPLLVYSFGSTKGELAGKNILQFTYSVRDFASLDSYASFIESRRSRLEQSVLPPQKITKFEYHKIEINGNTYLMSSIVTSINYGDTLYPMSFTEAFSFVTKNSKVGTIVFESPSQASAIAMRDEIIETLKF